MCSQDRYPPRRRLQAKSLLRIAAAASVFAVLAALVLPVEDASAQRVGNFNVGPRGGMGGMGGVGPRGPNFDGPRGPKLDSGIVTLGTSTAVITTQDATADSVEKKRSTRRTGSSNSGMPPLGETRFVPDEIILQVSNNSLRALEALAVQNGLTRLESLTLQLTGTTLYRWRTNGRPVRAVIPQMQNVSGVLAVQPNYLFQGAQAQTVSVPPIAPTALEAGDPAQYANEKLHLPMAHSLAKGDKVLVAVIDSGIDASHPELAGVIADSFDALKPGGPHAHGTAIAGIIAAHSRLMGVAPAAQILAVRAFDPSGGGAEGTTFNILKGLDWAASKGARVINMSFAGPADPGLTRALAAARQKGIVLIAAAGNAGPKSPPLYPGADPNVIAVTATDANDNLFAASNRGNYIAIAAPGVDILLPSPGGAYQVSSGTSFAAAQISGIVALILERKPGLSPEAVRKILTSTARDLGRKGPDPEFGAGLADAYQALMALDSRVTDAKAAATR